MKEKKINVYCSICGEQLTSFDNQNNTYQVGCLKCKKVSAEWASVDYALEAWMISMILQCTRNLKIEEIK